MQSRPQPIAISAAIGGILTTGVALLAVLWPAQLTPPVTAAIIAFGNAVILTASAVWAARKVTPLEAPRVPEGTTITVETPAGQPDRSVTV